MDLPRMPLTALVMALPNAEAVGPVDKLNVDHLAHDSRKIGPNGLFVALRGAQADGHLFIDKAVKNGAIAIVCEAMPAALPAGIACIRVPDTRIAMAILSATWHHHPSRAMALVGITGTNGKTTTAYLTHHLFAAMGLQAGLLGTIVCRVGGTVLESSMTTPDALDLNALLRRMVEAGCTAAVMEVSSHALDQHRVYGQRFKAGVFTNLTHDHLDYHGSAEAYAQAKKRLFDMLPANAVAVFNTDDPAGPYMVADTPARPISYGQTAEADVRFEILSNTMDGLQLRLDGHACRFQLVGAFNAYNLAAAYTLGIALGHPAETVRAALAQAPAVPGRFERIAEVQSLSVIVDYAHTPDALENVLQTIRQAKPDGATLWCVFGCGGDRDPAKRAAMGRIAERYADQVVVTSDNPRTEDPHQILAHIRAGFTHPEDAAWEVDRRAALQYAAAHAAPGDVVLIAGKGHEAYQVIGTEKHPFDDREEARTWFR